MKPAKKRELQQNALRLSPEERLAMVEMLWESLDPDMIPVADGHRQVLRQRVADADASPERFSTWEEARSRIHQGLRGQPPEV